MYIIDEEIGNFFSFFTIGDICCFEGELFIENHMHCEISMHLDSIYLCNDKILS